MELLRQPEMERSPPHAVELNGWFIQLFLQLYRQFAASNAHSTSRHPTHQQQQCRSQQRPLQSLQRGALLCGLFTINTILYSLKAEGLTRQRLDKITDEIAAEDAILLSKGNARDTMPHRQRHCCITVLTNAAQMCADIRSRVIASASSPEDPRSVAHLLCSGLYWQAVAK